MIIILSQKASVFTYLQTFLHRLLRAAEVQPEVRPLPDSRKRQSCLRAIPAGDIPEHPQGHCQAQQRQTGKPHFAARIPAEFLNFLKIRNSKTANQGPPEASGAWLWFVFGYFGCLWALSLQSNIGKGLLQIFVLLQQPLLLQYRWNLTS